MSQIKVTKVRREGDCAVEMDRLSLDTEEVVARAATDRYSVLYLRSGEKLFVKEALEEIERMSLFTETQREIVKRFKREIRECKAVGMSVDQAFAGLWEEVAAEAALSESDQAQLYQELLDWTKRWLK